VNRTPQPNDLHHWFRQALLEERELAGLSDHLSECSDCATFAQRLSAIDQATRGMPQAPPGLVTRIQFSTSSGHQRTLRGVGWFTPQEYDMFVIGGQGVRDSRIPSKLGIADREAAATQDRRTSRRPEIPPIDQGGSSSIVNVVCKLAAILIAGRGYGGFSLNEVAQLTGVSKSTLYRHWPTRPHFAWAAMQSVRSGASLGDSGDLRADLVAYGQSVVAAYGSLVGRRLIAELARAAASNMVVQHLFRTRAIEPDEAALAATRRAIGSSHPPSRADADLICNRFNALLQYQMIVVGVTPSDLSVGQLVDAVLAVDEPPPPTSLTESVEPGPVGHSGPQQGNVEH